MQIGLSIRGTLEDDETLQEIVSLLYRKTAKPGAPEVEIEAGAEAPVPAAKPKPKPAKPKPKTAPEPAPAPVAEAVTFGDVAAAGRGLLNAGKRTELNAILEAHGSGSLKDIAESEYPAILAEINGALA